MNSKMTIYNLLKAIFRNSETPTSSELYDKAVALSNVLPSQFTEDDIKQAVEDYEVNIGIRAFDPDLIVSETIDSDWLKEKKSESSRNHFYWERYEDYLREEKDFDEDTIKVLKRSTEEILGYCANPTPKLN